ncbi:Mitochondrial distribution and morphology protein 10 [Savitreella phatthalungensis]
MSAEQIYRQWTERYGLAQENFYSHILRTPTCLLDFGVPSGLELNLTSSPSTFFANSHRLSLFPQIGGALGFLFSSIPLAGNQGTRQGPLRDAVEGYQRVRELRRSPFFQADDDGNDDVLASASLSGLRPTLLFGRLHLPTSRLEAVFARRLSAQRQLVLTALSHQDLLTEAAAAGTTSGVPTPSKGTLLVQLQGDYGKYTTEWLYNTDDALLGFRVMRNLGHDPFDLSTTLSPIPTDTKSAESIKPVPGAPSTRTTATIPTSKDETLPLSSYGRFSYGMEAYYGAVHSNLGVSMGMRFATLPRYKGLPVTATFVGNPIVGHLSTTYTVSRPNVATLSSRLDFNLFSYESSASFGLELFQYAHPPGRARALANATHEGAATGGDPLDLSTIHESIDGVVSDALDAPAEMPRERNETRATGHEHQHFIEPVGIVKLSVHSATGRGGVLWQGRSGPVLVRVGAKVDLIQRKFDTVGCEVLYGA